jgi:hypothetical protein
MLWQMKQWHKDLHLILGESVDITQPISSIDCFIKFIFEKQPKFDLFHNISIYFIILDESVDIIENVNSIDCFINLIFE